MMRSMLYTFASYPLHSSINFNKNTHQFLGGAIFPSFYLVLSIYYYYILFCSHRKTKWANKGRNVCINHVYNAIFNIFFSHTSPTIITCNVIIPMNKWIQHSTYWEMVNCVWKSNVCLHLVERQIQTILYWVVF